MFEYNFPMVSATATVMLIIADKDILKSKIVVGLRSEDNEAAAGMWCLPGGFLNAKYSKDKAKYPGENLKDTAVREVWEETNIKIDKSRLKLFGEISDPNHDPRPAQVVSLWYWYEITQEEWDTAAHGDDLVKLDAVPYNELSNRILAFNHNEILEAGFNNWARS